VVARRSVLQRGFRPTGGTPWADYSSLSGGCLGSTEGNPQPNVQGATSRSDRGYATCVQLRIVTWFAVFVWFITGVGLLAQVPSQVGPMLADAELADVSFVDPMRGWAVGDRGAIWHTADGGATWRLQPSGVDCRLESVQFLDADNGWAAGGFSYPYSNQTAGVLLSTRDGGRSWQYDRGLVLPRLRQVRFFNATQGWAVGERSAMFPLGLFATDDGGRSWTPLAGELAEDWHAADFLDPFTGAVAGRRGVAAPVRRRGLPDAPSGGFGLRTLSAIKFSPQGTGWLVGDGGLVVRSDDAGASWQIPPDDVARHGAEGFDFRALAVWGEHAWIAGSPGTRVFHTADGGQTWDVSATGQNLPIRALSFVDPQHGWAVGALGTVLQTSDGGSSWNVQRRGGSRAAVLALFGEAEEVPLELLAELSGNDGYLSSVQILGRRDLETSAVPKASRPDRIRDAVVAVGASDAQLAWRFPLRQAGLSLPAESIVEGWNRANDGQGVEHLEEYLVRQIRCWRPEVVVTHAASPRGDSPLAHIVNQAVLRAVELAGVESAYPAQRAELGLPPWRVNKVFAVLPPGETGELNLSTSQLAPRLGRSLTDQASPGRALLHDDYTLPPATWGIRSLVDHVADGRNQRDLFAGITLTPGGEARRELVAPPLQAIDELRVVAQRHRNIQSIVARTESEPASAVRLLGQVGDLTRGLDDAMAAEVLYQLAVRCRDVGQWYAAAELFALIADRYPQHPLARPALVWLVQYWSSGEAAWREVRQQHLETNEPRGFSAKGFGNDNLAQVLPTQEAVALHTGPTAGIVGASPADRAEKAAEYGKRLEAMFPALHAEPSVQFPLALAQRQRGYPREAERFYQRQSRARNEDAWTACARAEFWLGDGQGPPPKEFAIVRRGPKPRLDGLLDDELWKRAKSMELRSPLRDDAEWPAVVQLACDAEYLFVSVRCHRAEAGSHEPPERPRSRDADLAAFDRVELFLDVDRDWVTSYRLTVDERGWTADSCWGDPGWDPNWFVASGGDDRTWTAECAIEWSHLLGRPPQSGDVWAWGAQRVVPGLGFQSWTTPADTSGVIEGLGLLAFE